MGLCCQGQGRDVGGADSVAVRDRRQALYRRAEQAAERLGLCLAELRVLGGDVRHRAVVLAELLAAGLSAARGGHRSGRRGVAVRGQRLGKRLDPACRWRGLDHRPVPALKLGDLAAGELGDRAWPGALGEESQRAGGQIVVGVLEGAPAGVGDREHPGRPATTAVAVNSGQPGLDHAVGQQMVKVTADRSRGQAKPGAQSGGGHRAVLQDQPGNPGTRTLLRARRTSADLGARWPGYLSHVFHNIIVP